MDSFYAAIGLMSEMCVPADMLNNALRRYNGLSISARQDLEPIYSDLEALLCLDQAEALGSGMILYTNKHTMNSGRPPYAFANLNQSQSYRDTTRYVRVPSVIYFHVVRHAMERTL